jgi:hypothetical protein
MQMQIWCGESDDEGVRDRKDCWFQFDFHNRIPWGRSMINSKKALQTASGTHEYVQRMQLELFDVLAPAR